VIYYILRVEGSLIRLKYNDTVIGTYTNDYGTSTGIKIEIDALTFVSVVIFGYAGSKFSGIIVNRRKK